METQNQGKKRNYSYFYGLLTGTILTLVVIGVISIGVNVYQMLVEENTPKENTIQNAGQLQNAPIIDKKVWNKLRTVESIIHNYYYKEDLDKEVVEEGAYRGMMDALGDPYSVYYSAEELTELLRETEGIYYGIGAYVTLDTKTNYPKIQGVIPGTPAESADLRPDDIIFEVDGVSTYDMDLTEAVGLIKGELGSTVTLTIVRSTENDYLYIDVERQEIESPTVECEMLDNDMAYIQILEFDQITIAQFADALATARNSGMKGLILDLRSNPGGSLTAVVEIAKMLLPEGIIVYTEDRNGERKEYLCDGHRDFTYPMVVLIDGNSASAAEILAGAIQDYEKGTLVGKTTYGKGIVQQVVSLNDGSAVKLTVSTYFTPKGRDIHGVGVSPDVECDFDGVAYYEEDYDTQLEKAKEVLADLIGQE